MPVVCFGFQQAVSYILAGKIMSSASRLRQNKPMESSPDFAWARQRVLEKLSAVELPPEATAELGPLATAYGEVYRYELRTDGSVDLMTLRELNDWVVIPRIRRDPGVADVSNFGGLAKQFSIELPPGQLRRFGMTFDDIVKAVETNNAVAGGSVMRRGGTSFVIRGTGSLQSTEEIGWFFIISWSSLHSVSVANP